MIRMRWKMLLIVFLTLISVTTFAAKVKAPAKAVIAENIFTEDKLNFIITPNHPEFTLKLKSNPTTGYSWYLREYDSNLMTPLTHSHEQPTTKLVGAPGYELWTFRIKPAGFIVPQQTTIRMIYARPWTGSDNSTQLVFRVTTQGK